MLTASDPDSSGFDDRLAGLEASAGRPAPRRTRGLRILIVEDDADSRWALCALMKRSGYDCEVAGDGEEALRVVERFGPQVILMDLMMPVLDGYEATRRLKADDRTRGIPILALTGDVTAHGMAEARAAGCDDFLTKPVSFAELIRRLDHYLP